MRGILNPNARWAASPSLTNPNSAAQRLGKLTMTFPKESRGWSSIPQQFVKSGKV